MKIGQRVLKNWLQQLGFDAVQYITNLTNSGDLLNPKKGASIVFSLGVFQVLLVRKKGWTLGEEDAEGGQSEVFQIVAGIFALAIVREVTNRLPEMAQ